MPPPLISDDGRWWWDGAQWRSRLVEGKLELTWFTSTPQWLQRVLVTGLIGLIPVVGIMVIYGWTLSATDMVRQRWRELPPAGFQYLERGVAPFVVSFVYALTVLFTVALTFMLGLLIGLSDHSHIALSIVVSLVGLVIFVAWWLLSIYLFAALLMGSDRLGIVHALDPRRLWMIARANHDLSIRIGLTYLLASLALVVVSLIVGLVIPFGALLATIALPALFASLAPLLASYRVEPAQVPPVT